MVDGIWSCILHVLLHLLVAVLTPPFRKHRGCGGVHGHDGLSPRADVAINFLEVLNGFAHSPLGATHMREQRAKHIFATHMCEQRGHAHLCHTHEGPHTSPWHTRVNKGDLPPTAPTHQRVRAQEVVRLAWNQELHRREHYTGERHVIHPAPPMCMAGERQVVHPAPPFIHTCATRGRSMFSQRASRSYSP